MTVSTRTTGLRRSLLTRKVSTNEKLRAVFFAAASRSPFLPLAWPLSPNPVAELLPSFPLSVEGSSPDTLFRRIPLDDVDVDVFELLGRPVPVPELIRLPDDMAAVSSKLTDTRDFGGDSRCTRPSAGGTGAAAATGTPCPTGEDTAGDS